MIDHTRIHESSKDAAANYLAAAIREIDRAFDQPGYAKTHPDLVAAFMQVAVADYAASTQSMTWEESIRELTDRLGDALENIADALQSE